MTVAVLEGAEIDGAIMPLMAVVKALIEAVS
jgi:hypothetical protein